MSALELRLWKTPEFNEWYGSLRDTEQARIDARLDRLKSGHLGASRDLGEGLFELKWVNGMRVYYSRKRIGEVDTIVIWGGFKGTQKADIKKARTLKERYENELKETSEGGSHG